MRWLAAILFICITASGWTDMVYLKSGDTVEGEIVEDVADYIKVKRHGHSVTYFRESIEKIERAGETAVHMPAEPTGGGLVIPAQDGTEVRSAQPVKQLVLEMETWRGGDVELVHPRGWSLQPADKVSSILQELATSIAEPGAVFRADSGMPVMVVGSAPRPGVPVGYQELIGSISDELKNQGSRILVTPQPDYCGGHRVIRFAAERSVAGRPVVAEKAVFFKGPRFFYVEVYIPAEEYTSYGQVNRTIFASVRFN